MAKEVELGLEPEEEAALAAEASLAEDTSVEGPQAEGKIPSVLQDDLPQESPLHPEAPETPATEEAESGGVERDEACLPEEADGASDAEGQTQAEAPLFSVVRRMLEGVLSKAYALAEDRCRLAMALTASAAALCAVVAMASLCGLVIYGVAWRGVQSTTPTFMSAQSLARIEATLSAEDVGLVESVYGEANGSGVRSFTGNPALLAPWSYLGELMVRAEAQLQAEDEGVDIGDSFTLHAQGFFAARFVAAEYESMGKDLARLQRDCIISKLMEALASMAAALGLVAAYEWFDERRRMRDQALWDEQVDVDSFEEAHGSAPAALTLLD